ncbi:MAG: DUF4037 domain-containing protein [Armatimonadota bacterium]
MTDFIPGLKLCEIFYHEVIQPILDRRFPALIHSAGRLERGSDILGFDTPQSMDHHWGPKTTLFLSETDCEKFGQQIIEALANDLPYEIRGFPTNFANPDIHGGGLQLIDSGPVTHGVTVTTVRDFFEGYLGVDLLSGINEIDWLLISPQLLRTVASGKVFHDGLGTLEAARRALEWYPKDIWLYILANQWRRIDQEEPFVGRCGDVGDELGSRIVASRLINELMRLCFLMERQYWTYNKWFGTAFSRLSCASVLQPVFHAVIDSQHWKEREKHLSTAYIHVARMHNELRLTEYIEPMVSQFHSRPYLVPHSDRFVEALQTQIESETVRQWPPYIGAVGQFADSTDVLDRVNICRKLHVVYGSDS